MKAHLLVPLAMALGLAVSSNAHAQHWNGELNVAKVGDLTGAELGLGYSWTKGRFSLTPTIGAFLYQADNTRYQQQSFNNGQSRCRDLTNGQFANDSYCNNLVAQAYGKLEGAVAFAQKWEVGAGIRVGKDNTTPYALIGAKYGPNSSVKAFAGKNYYGAGVSIKF